MSVCRLLCCAGEWLDRGEAIGRDVGIKQIGGFLSRNEETKCRLSLLQKKKDKMAPNKKSVGSSNANGNSKDKNIDSDSYFLLFTSPITFFKVFQQGFANGWKSYQRSTPVLLKIIDSYLTFLIVSGIIQFVYLFLAGPYPFNAFLAGFSTSVGCFVLTVNLRSQLNPSALRATDESNKAIKLDDTETKDFHIVDENRISIAPKRAFFDYIFANILLFSFAVNYLG